MVSVTVNCESFYILKTKPRHEPKTERSSPLGSEKGLGRLGIVYESDKMDGDLGRSIGGTGDPASG